MNTGGDTWIKITIVVLQNVCLTLMASFLRVENPELVRSETYRL